MPTNLPGKVRAHVVPQRQAADVDWLALWTISLGVCAVVLAAMALFVAVDKIGAAFILIGTAALIAFVLKANTHGYF